MWICGSVSVDVCVEVRGSMSFSSSSSMMFRCPNDNCKRWFRFRWSLDAHLRVRLLAHPSVSPSLTHDV